MAVSGAGAGVVLYDRAQTLEQLSRTEADRKANAKAIATIAGEISRPAVVNGFGSMGGKNILDLNISDSLRRSGGDAWESGIPASRQNSSSCRTATEPGRATTASPAASR